MNIKVGSKAVVLRDVRGFFRDLIDGIPVAAEGRHEPKVSERIFSSPGCDDDAEFQADWKEHVQTDLEMIFSSANDVVRRDLKAAETSDSGETTSIHIPFAHVPSWLNSLNQARLTLAARHDFVEKDMRGFGGAEFHSLRDVDLYRIHFYGFIQDSLVEALSERDSDSSQ